MLGEVPSGWTRQKLAAITEPINRVCGDDDLPVLSVSKVLGIVPQGEKFKKRIASADTARYRRVRLGEFAYDPMLLWDGSISRQMRVPEGVISPAYEVFRATRDVDHEFLLTLLKSPHMVAVYRNVSVGTNVRRKQADYNTFGRIEVPLPPLPEQKKIAAILSSVDEAIQATQAVIDQTRRVKEGLLQDLLTRGIKHTRFKQTEIGEIPEGWEVRTLGSLMPSSEGIKPGPFGSALTKDRFFDRGYKVYGQEQVLAGDLAVGAYYVAPEHFHELRKFEVLEGDLLLTLVGAGTPGKVLVVEQPFQPGLINPRLIRIRPPLTRLIPHFLARVFEAPMTQREILRIGQGGAMPVLSAGLVRGLWVPLPPLGEQRAIVERLNDWDDGLRTAELALRQHGRVKAGLLQDLLTGRVRVSP
jgi:type I restriction enzyme S subunit